VLSSIFQRYNKWKLKDNSFTIFSNDCWGAEVYHYYDLAYNTPFVGLYLMAPCYMKFLKDPESYLSMEFKFSKHSRYEQVERSRKIREKDFPTGILGDIEIQFLHYDDENEATEKWNRRKQRVNLDNLFVKFDAGKDGATDEIAIEFDNLAYKNKICLSDRKIDNVQSLVYCPDWEKDGAVMFKKSMKYFSISKWMSGRGL